MNPASPTPDTVEYWAGLRRHELLLQCCASCGALQCPPRPGCGACAGATFTWQRAAGLGRLESYTLVQRAVSAAYAVPFMLVLVRLQEGPMIMSTLILPAALMDPRLPQTVAVSVGVPVEVVFEDRSDTLTVPRFQLKVP